MEFIESPRLPTEISFGSSGGPRFNTTIASSASGFEQRVSNWSSAVFEYEAVHTIQTDIQLLVLHNFFMVTRGKAVGFRFQDRLENRSCAPDLEPTEVDQFIGVGDGILTTFQLIKTYAVGDKSLIREIVKPVEFTTLVALDGVLQTVNVDYTIDSTTGVIDFGAAPPAIDVIVSAGYEFDIPVRFDTDSLTVNLNAYRSGDASVPIVGLKS